MNKTISLLGLLYFCSIFFGYGQELKSIETSGKEEFSFNTDSLLYHIKTLSSDAFEGRQTGTKGAEKARDYIIKRYKNLNIQPLIDGYQQPFTAEERGESYNGVNLLGYIKGSEKPDKFIVISAHYDHEGIKRETIYNGADDNASGISAMLIFADYFQNNPPKHSIILAAFDAEELGLDGAKYFVSNSIIPFENIELNINMDMISRNDKNELYVAGTAYSDTLKSVVASYQSTKKITLLMGHDGKDGLQNWTYSGDHGPFYLKKIPFLYFGVEDHKDYHQPTDDFENIHPEFYKTSVETILNIFSLLDSSNLEK
jgi:Zn-dependent M28 family amino/carboxypeptidase